MQGRFRMKFDPIASAVRADPYPFYKELRERSPVSYVESVDTWGVARYDDVKFVLKNHQLFSSDPLIQIAFGEFNPAPGAPYMLASDPPVHTRLRKLVATAFTQRLIAHIGDSIGRMIHDLLDETDPDAGFDLIESLSSPLPVTVIADVMGIDTSMGPTFRRWSNQVTVGTNESISEETRAAIRQDAEDFRNYFIERIAAARRSPGDDMISTLVRAEEEGQELSADEVMAMCVLILIAGNETTTSTIGNAMYLLAKNPDQKALLLKNPELLKGLVEETLRYLSPIQMLFRRATQDVEIGGVKIAADSVVMPIYASANRDENMFANADHFDITRTDVANHMAFGHGIHFCIGQALGRFETTLALKTLLERMPNLVADVDNVEWNDSFYLRGPKRLWVANG